MQNTHLNNMKIKKFQFGGPGGFTANRKEIEKRNKAFSAVRKKTAQAGLTTLGWLGNAFNTVLTSGASSDFGQTSPFVNMDRPAIAKARENTRLKAKQTVEKATPYISPANHITAWTQGSFNPIIGAQKLEQLGPEAQLAGAIFDMATLSKGKPAIRGTVRAVDKGLARAGNKGARGRVIAKELDKNITEATKNGRIEVTDKYFNSPNHWYRFSERPEKMGLEEQGTNVTTLDDAQTPGTANGWRTSILQKREGIDIVPDGQGYFKAKKARFQFSKNGAAHGNTSQAAKGKIWDGTFAFSGKFPKGIIEGNAPSKVYRGMDAQGLDSRTEFVPQNWEEVPRGARIGFHTGEMPMSNLGWFQRTNKGTYTYEPIIPEKRIEIKPSTKQQRVISEGTYPLYRGRQYSVKEVVNSDGTINPRQAMKIQHKVSEQFPGSYKMEHRLENPEWHQNDPTTYHHTKNVARSAWNINPPIGFTKQDQMIAALGHDFGKIVAGDGHAQIGADLAKQVFPDLTDTQYTAIAEHMGTPTTPLVKVTKQADISNGRYSYSGYTPTKQNPSHYKFVKDVMQGYKWGINRNVKSAGNKDFTQQLKGRERLGYGAENDVYEDTTNPQQVLKVPGDRNGLITPHNTQKGAIREGQFVIKPFNKLPFNLPLNIEGTIKTSEGKYIPVFSQRKAYIPKMDQKKIIDFDKSVNGMYSLEKPNINNILLENDIQGATDFKLHNIGLLPDGTVMGVDLWGKNPL